MKLVDGPPPDFGASNCGGGSRVGMGGSTIRSASPAVPEARAGLGGADSGTGTPIPADGALVAAVAAGLASGSTTPTMDDAAALSAALNLKAEVEEEPAEKLAASWLVSSTHSALMAARPIATSLDKGQNIPPQPGTQSGVTEGGEDIVSGMAWRCCRGVAATFKILTTCC